MHPAKDYLNIELKEINNENIHLILYDVAGKVLIDKMIDCENQFVYQLNINQVKPGLQLLRIVTDKQTQIKKFIIQ